MKRIRKLLAVFLAAVFVAAVLPVSATEETKTALLPAIRPVNYNSTTISDITAIENTLDTEKIKKELILRTSSCSGTVNVLDLNIPRAFYKNVADLIYYNTPELFNISLIAGASISGDIIKSFNFTYKYSADVNAEMLSECEKTADKLLKGIIGNDNLNDETKVLLIHDRLAVWSEYGFNENQHNMYSVLATQSGVCQGYAMAYMYLLNKVGIRNYYCSSDALNHGWNIVYISNKPYHVDVTSDDPLPDNLGYVRHKYFLISSDTARSNYAADMGKNAADFDSTPDDTSFEGYYWKNVSSGVQLIGNDIYYIDDTARKIKKGINGDDLPNVDIDVKWISGVTQDGQYTYTYSWAGNYSRLANDGVYLYYSTPYGVYSYNPITNRPKEIYSYAPGSGNYSAISGIAVFNGTLKCHIKGTPNDSSPSEILNFVLGDANGDGQTNILDFIKLKKLLAEKSTQSINGIGVPETTDLVWIKRLLLAG